MTALAIRPGLPQPDYYAPNYQVLVEGQELSPETKGDVLEVKVTMDIENLTSFDLTFNNWDDYRLGFKYSDNRKIDVLKRVQIFMGYAGRLAPMVSGIITSLTPRFPDSGSPTINVSGQDLLFKLKNSKPDESTEVRYENKADWQVAEVIAGRHDLAFHATREGPVHREVIQKNQDDVQFLMERAKRIDFELFVKTDPDTGRDTLHFIKPTDGRDARTTNTYAFTYGRNLLDFNPTLSLSSQVSKLTVRGWDPRTKRAIIATAEASDLPPSEGGQTGPGLLASLGGGKQDRVVDAPVVTEQEAKDLAVSLLRERAYEFITGTGRIIGLPDLRPGDNLVLSGLGTRFSGRYYVKQVQHTLGSSGYLTQFEVRKFADGGVQ